MVKEPLGPDTAEKYNLKTDLYEINDDDVDYENNQRVEHLGEEKYNHNDVVNEDGSADIHAMLNNSQKLGDKLE